MCKQLLFALYIIASAPNQLYASETRPVDTSDFKVFIDKQLTLRPLINNAAFFYLNNDDEYFFHFEDDRKFLYRNRQEVYVESIRFGKARAFSAQSAARYRRFSDPLSTLTLTYKNDVLGRQTLILSAGNKDFVSYNSFTEFINATFVLDSSSDKFQAFAINENNGIVHSALSNHLLSTEHYSMTNDLRKEDSSFLCAACFIDLQQIDDMAFELYIGRQAINYFLSYNRVVSNDSLQKFLDSLGRTILESWPLPKKGYNYEFYLVDNGSINAFACPGGVIFINIGLLNSLDNNSELISILAHEIAHIEFRHGYRQYKSAQKSAFWASMAAAAVGAVIATTTDNTNTQVAAYAISASIIDLFATIILNGYSREHELEADRVSEFYLTFLGDSSQKLFLENVLKKLLYASGGSPKGETGSSFADHPPIVQRLYMLGFSQIDIFQKPIEFLGYDKFGNLVATFSILGQKQIDINSQITNVRNPYENTDSTVQAVFFTTLRVTEFLKSPCEAKKFNIKGIKGGFDNKEDTKVFPRTEVGIIFYFKGDKQLDLENANEISFSLNNIKYWKKSD